MTTLTADVAPASFVRPRFETVTMLIACCGAAIRCAAAVEGGRMPAKHDLSVLDIADIMPRTYRTGR